MAKLNTQQIRNLAIEHVVERPRGIRYTELVELILNANPETPRNTIHGSVWDLATRYPKQIIKPSRGLFKPAGSGDEEQPSDTGESTVTKTATGRSVAEADFMSRSLTGSRTTWMKR